jgi:hypothetical protein
MHFKARTDGISVHRKTAAGFLIPSLFLAIMCLMAGGLAHAQEFLGAMQGTIADASGARVANAEVVATETSTHFTYSVKSNASGGYALSGMNAGAYDLTVTAKSFKKETRSAVVLTSGDHKVIDFTLVPGAETETVTVQAENTLLDTGSPNIATTLDTQEVTDLPNEGRNPYVMATLAAGVINGGSGGYFQGHSGQYTNPFSGVAVQLVTNGTSSHNRLTLNGIPNDPAERLSGPTYTGFVPSPEAVQEVKISSSIYDAQVGHGNGTVTDVVVRTGANQYHGALYTVFQNTYLNANTAEKVTTQNAATNPTHRNNDQMNQSGLVFDGPVRIPKLYNGRDKTFFLAAFERYDLHTAQNYQTRIPSPAELAGDFSVLCNTFNAAGLCTNGIQLYQPNSPVDGNGNRTQYFANNNIASAINKTGAALAAYLPTANLSGVAFNANNYIATNNGYHSTYPSFILRGDQAFGQSNKLSAIYFQAGLTQAFPLMGFPKGIGPGGYGYSVFRRTKGGSLDEVATLSPSMVLESRFGLTYHPFGLVYPGSSGFDLSSLGISANGLPFGTFPGTSVGDGYASLAAGAGGQVSSYTVGSLQEILSKVFRNHSLRMGFEGNLLRYNVQNPMNGFGAFSFDRRFTQKNYLQGDTNSGDSFADQLLGYASSYSYGFNTSYALQQSYMAPFFQDDWHVSSKLTLNLGLRYDYESPYTERFNRLLTSFCTTCTNPLQSQVTGLTLKGGLQFASSSNRLPYSRDLNNLQPRVGAAYQWTPTTVMRAGFGIIYFNTFENPLANGFTQSNSINNYSNNLPINSISNPYPTGVIQPTGSALGLATALGQSISFYDPNHVMPKSAQYTLNVQQQLPGSMSLQIAYIGARPTRLEVSHDINMLPAQYYNQGPAGITYLTTKVPNPMAGLLPAAPSLNGATIPQSQLLLPYPEFGSVTEQYSSIGSAPYNAMQIQVNKPMSHHVTYQFNFTWDKVMTHTGYLNSQVLDNGKLSSIQDSNPTIFGNVFGTVELPKFEKLPYYERLAIGGWQFNTVVRYENGNLIGAPGNIDIIGDYIQPHSDLKREFNTCYQSATISGNNVIYANVNTNFNSSGVPTVVACDGTSPNPAFRQRISYTTQSNSSALKIRIPISPLMDASLFKKFIFGEGKSFEIRGEFFNIMNTPEWGGPGGIGSANAGSPIPTSGKTTQANDPRIGQLTARFNF